MKTEVFYCKSDMHVFQHAIQHFVHSNWQLWQNPIYVFYYTAVLVYIPNTILVEIGWTTVPCLTTNLSRPILICKSSARTKQSVISVAIKTHLEIRLGSCIYKTSLLHRPDDYIGFTRIWFNKSMESVGIISMLRWAI